MARKTTLKSSGISRGDALLGAQARSERLTPAERSDIARKAASARWKGRALARQAEAEGLHVLDLVQDDGDEALDATELPEAKHKGILNLMGLEIPCYVLSDGRHVVGRTSATEMLTGIKGGGALEKYVSVASLRQFIDLEDLTGRMVSFRLPEVAGLERHVKGLLADALIEMCQGFVAALEASQRADSGVILTARQVEMALKASMFLGACAKVGLDALIDEATGYQYERAQDALQIKLAAYLEKEMRTTWEKTFPDELWMEFGRLTGWSHSVTHRPKYWGLLVNELVYSYLDPDVFQWLKENAPAPRHGQNYHQWLTSQYGLKKLVEHIWKLIGIAQTCQNMTELKDRMAELHGRQPFQLRIYLPAPGEELRV
ncbi:MAG: P63C domain-containing protein [Candidatus Dormiibacterota bacterium]|jgi:hypothetical protein